MVDRTSCLLSPGQRSGQLQLELDSRQEVSCGRPFTNHAARSAGEQRGRGHLSLKNSQWQ